MSGKFVSNVCEGSPTEQTNRFQLVFCHFSLSSFDLIDSVGLLIKQVAHVPATWLSLSESVKAGLQARRRELRVEIREIHLSTSFVVVKIHETAGVAFDFPRIKESPSESHPIAHVCAAASPFPAPWCHLPSGLMGGITPAGRDVTSAAGGCHCVRHAGAGDSIREGRLPAS